MRHARGTSALSLSLVRFVIYVVRGRAERMKLLAAVSVAPPPPPPSPLKKWLSLSLSLSLTSHNLLFTHFLFACLPACVPSCLALVAFYFQLGRASNFSLRVSECVLPCPSPVFARAHKCFIAWLVIPLVS